MDDQLEVPTTVIPKDQQDEENGSSDEEGMPDWTNLPGARGLSRVVIPKRGEKEFEPALGGATALQSHVLNKSRDAMFEALRGSRGANSKTISYAVWEPDIARAHVIVARGTHFSVLGHSAVRQSDSESGRPQKRLELMPEEALYLMERGSLFCWRASEATEILRLHPDNNLDLEDCGLGHGVPMTVQQAFTEMIGTEGLSLHHYVVYAYLKRLGFVVGRATAPANTSFYPLPPSNNPRPSQRHRFSLNPATLISLTQGILVKSRKVILRLRSFVFSTRIFGSIVGALGVWPQSFNAASIFATLRNVRAGHKIILGSTKDPAGEFKIFWNVWKPSTPWRKLEVPKPDFEVVVVNARRTPMPDLHQLAELFSLVQPRPPPPPRKRGTSNRMAAATNKDSSVQKPTLNQPIGLLCRVKQALGLTPHATLPPQRPNPFVHLKTGNKSVIVAAVDGSITHLVRFGEGNFEDWPII